ncbi:hypothetical protein NF27_FN00010 [Candidatus Jidaibacter acanthamoeba]|uniref:Uncharacterized protein n=1 Tax=Candidatus Jidaibacter acanthamoebae TaxID=86105 RepID=A0A0C1MRY9_9RICK|nr:hypothetical protein [Candidatus Jidaibacter acanthamoeba]KIE04852.1 hypothetical protein NF27_FN00010 [Candidatus Jidaibacter acanthamoeba]
MENLPIKGILKDHNINQQPYVLITYGIINQIARDFLKSEQYLKKNRTDKNNDLVNAFKGQENNQLIIDPAEGR